MPHSQPNSADATPAGTIAVRGATEHNLKDIDVAIPRGMLTVVTGVSGSGKSSLAFDTICAEGRRRYLETFSSYARQFLGRLGRPAVRHIDGLSPAVAVEQSADVASPRSTVGTMTEVYDLLRLLWARAGTVDPGVSVRLERALFSFNSARGACPACKGLGVEDRLDADLLVADPTKSVRDGALRITTPTGYVIYSQVTLDVLDQVCRAHGFSVDIAWQDLTPEQRGVILNGSDRIRIPYGKHPLESRLRWSGITARPRQEGVYKGILPVMEQILRAKRNRNILRFVRSMPCRACAGLRLKPEALAVRFRGQTIADAAALPVSRVRAAFENETDLRKCARPHFGEGADAAVEMIARAVVARCEVLERLGLGYLTLDRESTTLSAGEAQRIRLARQAGLGLAGVLYVLDEPSVGLHPRDTGRLLDVLGHLRDAGNTVLVVEHDEQTIRHADWIVDVGPGAGHEGGEILYSGPAQGFTSAAGTALAPRLGESRTHAFLSGRERIAVPAHRRAGTGTLQVSGITKHNLHDVAVEFRLGAFNVVTGVSGAGKSTLVEETIRRVQDQRGPIDKVIAIDQAPIGRTPRSNPATYTGLFDAVRARFAAEPEAVAAGFDKGRFSFNVAGGRCDACEGAGVQQVGMQFLGTVAVVCEACAGRRFNDDTLRIRSRGKSIRDVLDMPIEEAVAFFADQPAVARVVGVLHTLGLGYLTLGHPATMLSGGEAQRVKLATELARPGTGRTLYVLDEPTTGLHAADIARLLQALNGLIEKGNTVIVIEHDLDVVKTADWVVDLGPEGGDAGGRVVVSGPPETVAASEASATGQALRAALSVPPREAIMPAAVKADARGPRTAGALIRFTNVTTHNLQHLDVTIPARQLTVVTGVSGSGKSSLAFDTIFAEGQQRFAGSFSTYGRRFVTRASDAQFDDASGVTPAVAIGQRAPSRNPRSTLATLTEIHDHYRLLFARLGTRTCPPCGAVLAGGRCAACGFTGVARLTASMFSPNSEHGACARCNGLGHVFECDPARLITDPSRPLAGGAMAGHKTGRFYGDPHGQHMAILRAAGQTAGIDVWAPWNALDARARHLALRGAGDRVFGVEWRYKRGARSGVHRFQSQWPGLLEYVRKEYDRKHADHRGAALEPLMVPVPCGACRGGKLQPEFLAVRFAGTTIQDLLGKTVTDSLAFFAALDAAPAGVPAAAGAPGAPLDSRTLAITADLRADVVHRLERLRDAGLEYLTLDRPATTLSGGEAQRVRLATQRGSGLTGITYVLDEPTVGLHPRDTSRLIALLGELRDAGNTVIVVEHDRDLIAAADHVLEIGPGAGTGGGRIVAQGSPAEVADTPGSRTSRLLSARPAAPAAGPRRPLTAGVDIRGAAAHNLRGVDIDVPAGGLVAVTGVSGSGKSSLVFDVLAPSVLARTPIFCRECVVHVPFEQVVRVESVAFGGSPWSTPATQVGLFEPLRDWFAHTRAASDRRLQKKHFSLATRGGRCETCEGLGQVRIPMDFLPDVWMNCEDCRATGFGPDVLACTIEGRSVADVLAMTVEEARGYLGGPGPRHPSAVAALGTPPEDPGATRDRLEDRGPSRDRHEAPDPTRTAAEDHVTDTRPSGSRSLEQEMLRRLDVLAEVGLGYVRLGQASRTLSGGERQRLLLASALVGPASRRSLGAACGVDRTVGPTLYLFDEPTTGLHADDVAQLLRVFDRLIDAGHSLVAVEHNLDVIAAADWVIDLGPEGGDAGGRLVAAGLPAALAATPGSCTGQALLAERTHRG
jgi:excinuclease ABC subunit A